MRMTHFFEDIRGEPDALRNILSSAISENRNIYRQAADALSRHTALYIVGMGASWHAGMAVASFFHARKRPAVLFDAAELLYHGDLAENSCVLLLSRSGKSREVVDLTRHLHIRNITIVSITNDPQSPMALESDYVIDLQSAFDRNVSVTMYSGIALAGCLLAALSCGEEIDPIAEQLDFALVKAQHSIAGWVQQLDASDWLAVDTPYYFLARGASVASCNEARLLWEEAAKSTATALTTSGFRHGPQEMVREGLRVAIWLDKDHLQRHDLKLASDLRTLGAKVLLIGQQIEESPADLFLELPPIPSEWQFLIDIMPIQIAAERLASLAGRDCDAFRFCSYIVTEEGGLALSDLEEGPVGGGTRVKNSRWLLFALATPLLWGVWGALTEYPEKWISPPFPATLGYVVWSMTMIPVSLFVLWRNKWKVDTSPRSILYGSVVGISGALGQLLLFWVLTRGPAYIIFPIICLSPAVTILLSATLLRERARGIATLGILLSMPAILLLALQEPDSSPVHGHLWLILSILIFLLWGVQAYFMKSSAHSISSQNLFFYMTLTGLMLSPIALWMTDFSAPINWGLKGAPLTALIQSLNAWGCLFFVYAIRLGKAIIVVPMVNGLFPVVTIVLSLLLYHGLPTRLNLFGILLALAAILLMAFDEVHNEVSLESVRLGRPETEPKMTEADGMNC